MPYAELGSLLNCLKIQGKMRPAEQELLTVCFCEQMLRCLYVLQTARLIHSDIKPDNWVLKCHSGSSDLCVCLIDFGKTRPLEIVAKNNRIQVKYMGAYAARGMQSLPLDQPWGREVYHFSVKFEIVISVCVGWFDRSSVLFPCFIICFWTRVELMVPNRVYTHGVCGKTWKVLQSTQECFEKVISKLFRAFLGILWLIKRYWNRELWSIFFEKLLNAASEDQITATITEVQELLSAHLKKCGQAIRDCNSKALRYLRDV